MVKPVPSLSPTIFLIDRRWGNIAWCSSLCMLWKPPRPVRTLLPLHSSAGRGWWHLFLLHGMWEGLGSAGRKKSTSPAVQLQASTKLQRFPGERAGEKPLEHICRRGREKRFHFTVTCWQKSWSLLISGNLSAHALKKNRPMQGIFNQVSQFWIFRPLFNSMTVHFKLIPPSEHLVFNFYFSHMIHLTCLIAISILCSLNKCITLASGL